MIQEAVKTIEQSIFAKKPNVNINQKDLFEINENVALEYD